jgi:hypothetical protein
MDDKSKTTSGILQNYRIVFFAGIVLSTGVAMVAISASYLSSAQSCQNYGDKNFLPGTVITATCQVSSVSGQDLLLSAYFYSSAGNVAGGETIQLPAHLEVRDPNNAVLYDLDFNDRTSISIKPEAAGTYTATITSLQSDYHPVWKQTTYVVYSFGLSPAGSIVDYGALGAVGNLVITFGVIFVIISVIKVALKRKSSLLT